MAKPALGRGLGALMGGVSTASKPAQTSLPSSASPRVAPQATPPSEQVQRLAIAQIRPCSFQPRRTFTEESLRELAASIQQQGVLQPVVVRPRDGAFELIAGERRWRAAQIAGLKELPALIREADDRQVLELALIENLQRENLNPIEEALGYYKLIQEFSLTQEEAAGRVGKSRVTVANLMRLLQLPEEVQNQVRTGELSFGHARAILSLPEPTAQLLTAQEVVRHGLSVRETEKLVAARTGKPSAQKNGHAAVQEPVKDVHVADLQNRIQERLGTKVSLKYSKGKGSLEVRFFNDDDLQRVLEILGVTAD